MKKIIALLVLFFAFSINASAQDNTKNSVEKNAKNDVAALSGIINLDSNTQTSFYNLFKKKHIEMSAPGITEAGKKQISSMIEAKIRATLNGEQTIVLEKNKAVLTQLISGAPSTEIKEKK